MYRCDEKQVKKVREKDEKDRDGGGGEWAVGGS